jgi:hypothetical protein
MKTFKVHIEETICGTFTVEAETMEEAMEIAEEKYAEGEFVIIPQAPTCKQMMAECDENGKTTEWVEF